MLESQKLNEIRSAVAGLIEQSMIAKLPEDVSGLGSVSGATDAVESLTDDVVQRITDRIQIRYCAKCGTIFATMNGRQVFCCRDCSRNYGKDVFKNRLESDQALAYYNKAYKAMTARRLRKRISQDELESWRVVARDLLARYRCGDIGFEEFKRRISFGIRRWERFEEAS